MKPVPFISICIMLAGSLTQAQTNPASPIDPNYSSEPSRFFRAQQGSSFGQHGARSNQVTPRPQQAPQMLGLDFANAVVYGSGGFNADSVAVADVNGDGKPDIVVLNCAPSGSTECNASGTLAVLLNNGDGTFKAAVTYSSGGNNATSIAVADVNGDGKPDILVTNACADSLCVSGSVGVLLNNGDGTFKAAVTYGSGGAGADSIAVADLKGDGKLDLIVANCGPSGGNCTFTTGVVGVLAGNGDGTFQTAMAYSSGGLYAYSVAVADLRGDGKLDVVVTSGTAANGVVISGQVGVLLGNGDGTVQAAAIYNTGGHSADLETLAIADVNGDSKPDLVVANGCGDSHCSGEGNSPVGVLLGNGDGTFQTVVTYDSGAIHAGPIAIADMNGDGNPDLVVTDEGGGSCAGGGPVAVLLGNGDGTFQAPVNFCSGGSGPLSVAVADVNGDSRPDLVVANRCVSDNGNCNGLVGVLLNTSTSAILSATSLTFTPQAPGTNSSPQMVTLTNIGTAPLTLSSIAISGADATGFAETNTCPSTLAAKVSCQIRVTSVPNAAGAQTASLNIADSAPESPQTVSLNGVGQDFSLAASSTNITVTPGQAANYTMTVSPVDGFSQTVTLSCSGAPPQSTCTVSPGSVTLNGSANATTNVAVVTAGNSASLVHPAGFPPASSRVALWMLLPGVSGLVMLGNWDRRSRKKQAQLLYGLAFLCLFSFAITLSGCGGGGGGGGGGSATPVGNYSITVTGTFTAGSTKLTHNAKLTLIVQ